MTDLERIEAELREIKSILMILCPSYGVMEKRAASIFGWTDGSDRATVRHAKRRRDNGQGDRSGPSRVPVEGGRAVTPETG